ncbi:MULTISPECIES: hypothetical protein [unclassified Sulfitobacter]|uniref:hypothetical protein n=1 Tax=unclassified Sulfitobacter TaxID=196795 RepID=UPI0007C2C876|nr:MULTISPECIES: hypothetical protein [unclassified Sulfitobacter]KZX99021.1 hypothetical protein A3720_14285 [Sulfitobacter sp. HI0021]KZY00177.1 hypothetical protein A3722_11500 [Sulfitobacter sp. HI0027]KZZ00423.1 hypothetical protein A3747_05330 [Sulfitobacter sp. HI0076]
MTKNKLTDLNDHELIREARELGCNDNLMQQLADRVEALRGGLEAIKRNPSLASCQLIAAQSLEG